MTDLEEFDLINNGIEGLGDAFNRARDLHASTNQKLFMIKRLRIFLDMVEDVIKKVQT